MTHFDPLSFVGEISLPVLRQLPKEAFPNKSNKVTIKYKVHLICCKSLISLIWKLLLVVSCQFCVFRSLSCD